MGLVQVSSLHELSSGGQIVGYSPQLNEPVVILKPEHTGDVFLLAEGNYLVIRLGGCMHGMRLMFPVFCIVPFCRMFYPDKILFTRGRSGAGSSGADIVPRFQTKIKEFDSF
jgi:hypothetical protein